MNKVFIILFVLLYSLQVVDASFSVHKCMGELKSVTIGTTKQVCCCGSHMNDICCGSEFISFTAKDNDELFSSFSFLFYNDYFIVLDLSYYDIIVRDFGNSLHAFVDYQPPAEVDIYLHNCSFIYYG